MTTVWNEYNVWRKKQYTHTHTHMSTLSTASGTDIANIVVDIAIPEYSHTRSLTHSHTFLYILFGKFFNALNLLLFTLSISFYLPLLSFCSSSAIFIIFIFFMVFAFTSILQFFLHVIALLDKEWMLSKHNQIKWKLFSPFIGSAWKICCVIEKESEEGRVRGEETTTNNNEAHSSNRMHIQFR